MESRRGPCPLCVAHLAVGVIICLSEPALKHSNILCDAGTDVLQSGRDVRRAGVPDNSSWKRDVHVHCNDGERQGTGNPLTSTLSVATENKMKASWSDDLHALSPTHSAGPCSEGCAGPSAHALPP